MFLGLRGSGKKNPVPSHIGGRRSTFLACSTHRSALSSALREEVACLLARSAPVLIDELQLAEADGGDDAKPAATLLFVSFPGK